MTKLDTSLEAHRLRWIDVDQANRVLFVTERDGRAKTVNSCQSVPIPASAATVLEEWRASAGGGDFVFRQMEQDRPWNCAQPGYRPTDQLRMLGERADVPGLTLLSLRHSWATHAESAWGLTEAQIQRVLRHTNPRTQRGYRHADMNNLRKLSDDIRFG